MKIFAFLHQDAKRQHHAPTLTLREAAVEFGTTTPALHNWLWRDPAAPAVMLVTGKPPVPHYDAAALRRWWQGRTAALMKGKSS